MPLFLGDCLDVLKTLEPNSIDSLVTDPPAGISFMGKDWDHHKGGRDEWVKWMTEIMRECMRVMKPGAHGLVWALPRTSHWTATALEDAGFEVRDVVTHLFGTGFPKSLDISKAIDKAAGAEREVIGSRIADDIRGGALINQEHKTHVISITVPSTSEAKQWQGWGTALKPSVENWFLVRKKLNPMDEMWYEVHTSGVNICQFLFNVSTVPESLKSNLNALSAALNTVQWNAEKSISILADLHDQMVTLPLESMTSLSWNIVSLWSSILVASFQGANTFTTEMVSSLTTELKTLNCYLSKITRESITQDAMTQSGDESNASNVVAILKSALIKFSCIQGIIAPKIAIKTNCNSEHYILIRKPCSEKTVAANVLKHGTGGINIDGCRIPHNGDISGPKIERGPKTKAILGKFKSKSGETTWAPDPNIGRFPANLVLDEAAAEMLDEQSGLSKSTGGTGVIKNKRAIQQWSDEENTPFNYGDFGGASRFFYVAKASKADRNEGLDSVVQIKYSSGLCKEENTAAAALLQKVTSESTVRWNTDESGNLITATFQKECRSTIETEISRIIESKILNLLLHSLTDENIQDVSLETENGGSLAADVKNLNSFLLNTINAKTASVLGVVNAALQMLAEFTASEETAYKNIHSTVKSTKLMSYLCKLVTPTGGTILDPFMGSGSTGKAAKQLGFEFVGIEQDKEYFEIAKRRVK